MSTPDRPTILVAEDNATLRTLIAAILTGEGDRVLDAPDGAWAVRLAAQEQPDAVLIDVRLGPDDGIGLAREFRQLHPDLPVALLSGDSSEAEAVRRAADLTALFLSKPFASDELVAAVERLLDHCR